MACTRSNFLSLRRPEVLMACTHKETRSVIVMRTQQFCFSKGDQQYYSHVHVAFQAGGTGGGKPGVAAATPTGRHLQQRVQHCGQLQRSVSTSTVVVCLLLHQLACAHHCSSPTGCVSCGKFMSFPHDRGCHRASTILFVLNTHTHTHTEVHTHMWRQTHPHRCLCYFLMCHLQLFMCSSGVCFGLLGTL